AALGLDEIRRDNVRTAAFVTTDWSDDVVRFAGAHDAALVLVDTDSLSESLLQRTTADVALVFRGDAHGGDGPVYVPFGGGDHDGAAVEVAAALGGEIRLVGTSRTRDGRRGASRVLADASLALQQAFGVSAAPVLTPPATD